jgi:hypothetical protein
VANNDKQPARKMIYVSETMHERCKAWAALHGKEITEFVEEWIEQVTKKLKPIHDEIRRGRKK